METSNNSHNSSLRGCGAPSPLSWCKKKCPWIPGKSCRPLSRVKSISAPIQVVELFAADPLDCTVPFTRIIFLFMTLCLSGLIVLPVFTLIPREHLYGSLLMLDKRRGIPPSSSTSLASLSVDPINLEHHDPHHPMQSNYNNGLGHHQDPSWSATRLPPDEELTTMLDNYFGTRNHVYDASSYQPSPGQQSVDSGFGGEPTFQPTSSQNGMPMANNHFYERNDVYHHQDDLQFYSNYLTDYTHAANLDCAAKDVDVTTDQDLSVIVDQVLDSIESQFSTPTSTPSSHRPSIKVGVSPSNEVGGATAPFEQQAFDPSSQHHTSSITTSQSHTPSGSTVLCDQCASLTDAQSTWCGECGSELITYPEQEQVAHLKEEEGSFAKEPFPPVAKSKAVAVAIPRIRKSEETGTTQRTKNVGVVEPRVVPMIKSRSGEDKRHAEEDEDDFEEDEDGDEDGKCQRRKRRKQKRHKRCHHRHRHHHKKRKRTPDSRDVQELEETFRVTETLPEHVKQVLSKLEQGKIDRKRKLDKGEQNLVDQETSESEATTSKRSRSTAEVNYYVSFKDLLPDHDEEASESRHIYLQTSFLEYRGEGKRNEVSKWSQSDRSFLGNDENFPKFFSPGQRAKSPMKDSEIEVIAAKFKDVLRPDTVSPEASSASASINNNIAIRDKAVGTNEMTPCVDNGHDNAVADDVCTNGKLAINHEENPIKPRPKKKAKIVHSTKEDKWVSCPETWCDFATCKPARMTRHKLCHEPGSRYYHCPDCNDKFGSLARMLRHDRKEHTGEKDYECRICEAEVTDIAVHMRVHKPSRDFKCDICSIEFKHKNSLVRHLVHHSTNRPFRCNQCNLTFHVQSRLREHERKKHDILFKTNRADKNSTNVIGPRRQFQPIAPAPVKNYVLNQSQQQQQQQHRQQQQQQQQQQLFPVWSGTGAMFLMPQQPQTFFNPAGGMPLLAAAPAPMQATGTGSPFFQPQPVYYAPALGQTMAPFISPAPTSAQNIISIEQPSNGELDASSPMMYSSSSPTVIATTSGTSEPPMATTSPTDRESSLDLPNEAFQDLLSSVENSGESITVESETGEKKKYNILERAILEISELSCVKRESEEGDAIVKSENGENPFKCNKCGKEYKFENFLKVHQRRPCSSQNSQNS